MRVIIAGGGTGGLAAAIALRKVGIEPLVLEEAPAFTAIGAGLGLYANAMKALSYLGADGYWRENVARIDVAEQRGLTDDELITTSSLDPQAAKYGEHYYCGHRADLLSSLLAALPPDCVQTGSRVVAFEETDRDVRVELESEPEALFGSAARLAERARGAGVPVTFSPVADSVHSFILFDFLPETDRALTELATFAYVVGAR
jgi:2-polyprenyl-6-methoxyphenol hydroxylase-like FAD-dependent oxidoreductase